MDFDVLTVSYDAGKNGDMSSIVAVRRTGVNNEITSYFVGQEADRLYKLLTMEERDAL